MYQWHLISDTAHNNTSYLLIRTPDYKSSGWHKTINVNMFKHDFDNLPGHYSRDIYLGKSIEEVIQKDKSRELLFTFDSIDDIKNSKNLTKNFPELFV